MQLHNQNTGTAAEMRFITAADDDSYMAFTAPGSGNTSSFWGETKSGIHAIFSTGGRDLAIGPLTANSLLFGVNTDIVGSFDSSGNFDVASGNITVSGTVDGRDLATDGSKLDGIEASADVTDTANVTAAGALMDSEVDADLKTLSLPANTTISTFGASLVDDADAATARTTLDVDQAGTDNSTNVTLAGTPDYLTISGQEITRNQIDLTTDVTGALPDANIASSSTWNGKMDDVVDDTSPQLGGNLDWNSKGMVLTGQSISGGSTGDLMMFNGTNWVQADSSASSTGNKMIGINLGSSTILTHGIRTTTGLTSGSIYYMSETAGGITATAPTTSGSIVRIVGYALSTTELFVDPDKTFVENA